ncbi:MAG: helix-turn-helix domain-containing protein [Chloroflexi bacterium]|nr:helix-turn-helix domain-containing protein [Chloroflexota bacterium]
MPLPKRPRVEPTDDWQQLQLLVQTPAQLTYELIRPVVLFGRSPAERARETGAAERTIYRQVARFEAQGMAGLLPAPATSRSPRLPDEIRRAILHLKAEYPAFRPQEIVGIIEVRFGHQVSHHTVKRILEAGPLPPLARRRYPPYQEIPDPAERRLAIIRLHAEGWHATSIAGYLGISRKTVHLTLRRWFAEGVAGLDDKSRVPKAGVRKVDLRAIEAVRHLQENPELGAFRIQAALKREGIELSERTCGRILARNRQHYGLGKPGAAPHQPKPMPFRADRRHQYWTVDIRYLDMHQLGGGHIYMISVLDNYSRAILASGLSRTQDAGAYLMVLYAAIRQFGSPEAIVSDGGGVFRAKPVLTVYEALGIRREQIDQGQPWQSYIETQFNVMRRLADWHVGRATSWAELLAVHDHWVVEFNYQDHWAHREREDGKRSPQGVLGWVRGTVHAPEELHRVFCSTRFGRRLDRAGYVRFRHWRIYGEQGLMGASAAVWLYGEHLTLEFAEEPLAQYTVTYQPDGRHLRTVAEPRLFDTPFRSPQAPLWELSDAEWLKALRLPARPPRTKRPVPEVIQERLFS